MEVELHRDVIKAPLLQVLVSSVSVRRAADLSLDECRREAFISTAAAGAAGVSPRAAVAAAAAAFCCLPNFRILILKQLLYSHKKYIMHIADMNFNYDKNE